MDGQTFVKPPEVLARDRLLGSYEVSVYALPSTPPAHRQVGNRKLLASLGSLLHHHRGRELDV